MRRPQLSRPPRWPQTGDLALLPCFYPLWIRYRWLRATSRTGLTHLFAGPLVPSEWPVGRSSGRCSVTPPTAGAWLDKSLPGTWPLTVPSDFWSLGEQEGQRNRKEHQRCTSSPTWWNSPVWTGWSWAWIRTSTSARGGGSGPVGKAPGCHNGTDHHQRLRETPLLGGGLWPCGVCRNRGD